METNRPVHVEFNLTPSEVLHIMPQKDGKTLRRERRKHERMMKKNTAK